MYLSPSYAIRYAGNWGKATKDAVRDSQSEGWRRLAVARKGLGFGAVITAPSGLAPSYTHLSGLAHIWAGWKALVQKCLFYAVML